MITGYQFNALSLLSFNENLSLSSIRRIWPEISYRSPNHFWDFLLQ
ncbi:hypothetical protein V6Z12_D03G044100 [Gossypium hirsutum]